MNYVKDLELLAKEMKLSGYDVEYDGNRKVTARLMSSRTFLLDLWDGARIIEFQVSSFGCQLAAVRDGRLIAVRRFGTMEEGARVLRELLDKYQ